MSDWDWTRIVFDHVHIRVRDAAASVAFYRTALEPLGIPAVWEGENGAQFANLVVTDGEPYTSGPVHIAFSAVSREQVDAFHRAALGAGGRDNGPPGVREQYSSEYGGRYYAGFVLDPDGNNVEAVYRQFET
jgi:catechol 2,3-dioxygenase-like lactoylglutathione lyase family enzyme